MAVELGTIAKPSLRMLSPQRAATHRPENINQSTRRDIRTLIGLILPMRSKAPTRAPQPYLMRVGAQQWAMNHR